VGLVFDKKPSRIKQETGPYRPLAGKIARRIRKLWADAHGAFRIPGERRLAEEVERMLRHAISEKDAEAAIEWAEDNYGSQFCYRLSAVKTVPQAMSSWLLQSRSEQRKTALCSQEDLVNLFNEDDS